MYFRPIFDPFYDQRPKPTFDLFLWLASRPRNHPRNPKSFRDTKTDSKVTLGRRPQSDLRVTQKQLKSHFRATFESLFESLSSYF